MIDYSRVANFVKACSGILEQAEKINKTTLGDLLGIEDPNYVGETLTSTYDAVKIDSLFREGLIGEDDGHELMNKLEENLKILAKADLIEELLKEVKLAEEHNQVVDFRVGYKFEYAKDQWAEVLDFKLVPGVFNKAVNQGLVLCKRDDFARPYVVWQVYLGKLDNDRPLDLCSGEYFADKEEALEYFNQQSV